MARRQWSWRFGLVLGCAASLPAEAVANGNVSHQWISKTAAELVPADGSLRALVGDPALRQALYTGTMFPDWGYTPGATADEGDAGESSHWEPVQEAYRRWIGDNFAPPWSDEARLHLAFYLGMTSHGIADQTYDAMFFERSEFYEAKDHSEFDQDSDVMWAGATGPGEVPTLWLPTAPLLALFESVVGKTIDGGSMAQKVGLVGFAIHAVSAIAADPEGLADAEADFPWAAAHDDDPAVPGNPPSEAQIARRYWQSNWALIHGESLPRPVLWTFPVDGGSGHATPAASIESWISVVFARGLDEAALSASQFHVVDSADVEAPIEIDLFYGESSHVVHIKPTSDLLADEVYVVTVDPGVQTIHGESLAGWSFTFSTGAMGPPPVNDDGFWDVADDYAPEETSSSSGDESGSDGSSGSEEPTSSSSGGEVLTGAGESQGSSGGDPTSSTTAEDAATAGTDTADSGCACATTGWTGPPVWLLLVPLLRRRREQGRSFRR
ncbi:Ig-like domain-containing protein [Nannocystis punicea]|uniref:Ig-like domain-containing protein n=1 Tax=Nannocystis punicea TaxID=2995304 RepID=A0ABY7GW55_9BACT|nr:Ig-like domain-containing protein [Nannocystis poenicansa]WAS91188.1 Ig-like domain-containing protein [Nannocystis poenicansa]